MAWYCCASARNTSESSRPPRMTMVSSSSRRSPSRTWRCLVTAASPKSRLVEHGDEGGPAAVLFSEARQLLIEVADKPGGVGGAAGGPWGGGPGPGGAPFWHGRHPGGPT